ncbi:MAG TPA: hypothetical protein VEQ42_01330, partial [Pyrinomonadaceae bacterium]|nr:hypothetical protein [Pyrinomonadaceae bacterium]
RLPEFEAAIVERLRAASGVYWVADATSSEINSLVEYPLTTVVLVLKPPGSEHEFEFKRAGRRGARPLGVVYARDGNAVPPSHRLDGGSAQWLLRYESNASAKFARLYRLVHGDDAPVSSCVSRRTVYAVPGDGGERNLLDYFTERHIFGEGFDEMRAAMRECVEAFLRENSAEPLGLPGDIGRTAQFLTHAAPTQAVLVNTSSFRLDRLAAYLAPDGPKTYFTEGLRVSYSRRDARRFADELLDEILCVYEPPPVAYKNHAQYVAAALAVAANRRRADENFLAVMRQTATLWGTLLAMRGNSSGESFVARNVGLRSVWEAGRWRIKILYMDHDNLVVPDQSVADFHSLGAHQGTALDELFIWSFWEGQKWTVGAVECLESIYRAGPELSREGRRQFDDALAAAYRETQDVLDTNAELRQFFNAKFLERMRDWDAVVRGYLDRRHDAERLAGWKEQTLAALTPKGYDRNVLVEHFVAAERFAAFFEKYSFLYSGELNNDDESA